MKRLVGIYSGNVRINSPFCVALLPDDSGPTAPSNLTLLQPLIFGDNKLRLTWDDNSNDETAFSLERSTDGNSWAEIATPSAGDEAYTDTGLTIDQTYYYRIRANRSGTYSSYSNTVSGSTTQLISWVVIADATASGASIRKTTLSGGHTMRARSTQQITAGDTFVEYTVGAGYPDCDNIRFGVTANASPGTDFSDFVYGLYADPADKYSIKNAALESDIGNASTVGHVHRIEFSTTNNNVLIKVNGSTIKTWSAQMVTYPQYIMANCYIGTTEFPIVNAKMGPL